MNFFRKHFLSKTNISIIKPDGSIKTIKTVSAVNIKPQYGCCGTMFEPAFNDDITYLNSLDKNDELHFVISSKNENYSSKIRVHPPYYRVKGKQIFIGKWNGKYIQYDGKPLRKRFNLTDDEWVGLDLIDDFMEILYMLEVVESIDNDIENDDSVYVDENIDIGDISGLVSNDIVEDEVQTMQPILDDGELILEDIVEDEVQNIQPILDELDDDESLEDIVEDAKDQMADEIYEETFGVDNSTNATITTDTTYSNDDSSGYDSGSDDSYDD